MPKSLTKEQRRQLTFSSQANTEEDLMEVFRREHMFDGAVSQNLSEGGYAMSEEEKRKVDSHLKDRKQLQDEKKRVRDKSAENIAKTDERVQALGHMDTAKKQLKNYMDKYVESAEFDELVKSKLKDANPNLAKLIDWGDRLNEMLDDLLQTPGMTEKTKVAIYNKIQGTRQYVNGCTKELARCIYMKDIFTKKLGENIKDENLINELINMDEISKYQKDIENFVGNSEEKEEEKEFEIGKEGEEKELGEIFEVHETMEEMMGTPDASPTGLSFVQALKAITGKQPTPYYKDTVYRSKVPAKRYDNANLQGVFNIYEGTTELQIKEGTGTPVEEFSLQFAEKYKSVVTQEMLQTVKESTVAVLPFGFIVT